MILSHIWLLMILRNSPSKSLSEINLFPHATMLLTWHVNHFLKLIPLLAIWWHFTSAVTKLPSDYLRISPNLPKPILNNINSNYVDIISGHSWHDSHCSSERARPALDWRCWCDELASVLSLYPSKKRHKKQLLFFFSIRGCLQ